MVGMLATIVLITVFLFQYNAGLEPCTLCLYQRVPWIIMLILPTFSILKPAYRRHGVAALGLLFLISAGLALYHVGVEQHWWAYDSCTTNITAQTAEDLIAQLQSTTAPPCDEIQWSLLGVSMAGYNLLLSTMMFLVSVKVYFHGKTEN